MSTTSKPTTVTGALWLIIKGGAQFFVPEYLGQPKHFKNASVRKRILPMSAYNLGLGFNYFLEVEFDKYQDSQSVYPASYRRRRGFIAVSKELYHQRPVYIDVFCQYSRKRNKEDSVKLSHTC